MEETAKSGLKYCENCGALLQPGLKYCDNCGHKIVYNEKPVFPSEEQGQSQGFPPEEQGQSQGFAAEQQGSAYQQGNTYQQNSYQQNSYQQNSYQQNSYQQGAGRPASNAVLPPKLGCVLAYLFPLIGCIALYCLGDREDDFVRHHLNQALVINILETIAGFVSRIGWSIFNWPFRRVGGAVDILCLAFFLMGIVRAYRLSAEPLPYIGEIHLID